MGAGFSTGLMFLIELTVKMGLTAAIVVAASVVVERSGPLIAVGLVIVAAWNGLLWLIHRAQSGVAERAGKG
jgi:hypothetical protein